MNTIPNKKVNANRYFFTVNTQLTSVPLRLITVKSGLKILFLAGLITALMNSCRKEKFFNGNTSLQISSDTLWFDTIFTKAPGSKYPISVTRIFWIKNKEKGTVKVDFKLAGGANSPYRINIDGFAGTDFKEIEIPAKDSIFVFVQCTLEANNQTMPSLVMDSLVSSVNGHVQKTIFAAYGWDAHYFQEATLSCNEVWDDKIKPYVIVDYAFVPSGCTFTVKEGVTVYNSARSVLLVAGSLKIEGTESEPVNFTGDKPGAAYRTLPNQWGGIYLTVGSANNTISNARIHNASIGIRVDSLPVTGSNNLILNQSSVMYCGQACLAGITANIEATNCLFAQAGSYTFLGLLGGNYNFKHCTFANYAGFTVRREGSFALTNTLRDGNGVILKSSPLNCTVVNSIIYGFRDEEFLIDSKGWAPFTTSFTQNLIASKDKPFSGNIYNSDPLFSGKASGDFTLSGNSPAIDAGNNLVPAISVDLLGKPRDSKPDLGAYEKIP